MRRLSIMTALLVVACVLFAGAESPGTCPAKGPDTAVQGGDSQAKLKKADANQDGQVTFEEVSAAFPNLTREQFEKYDRNGDGILTQADAPAGPRGERKGRLALLKRADADGNQQVTFEELLKVTPNVSRERFAKMDRNNDGVLSPADRPVEHAVGEAPGGPHGGSGGHGGKMAKLAAADVNNDRQVTFEELQAVLPDLSRERFDKMDHNHDGVLTPGDRGAPAPANTGKRKELAEKIHKADTDGDGKTTFEEVTAAKPGFPREAFDKLDTNKDGVLSKEDAPAVP